MVKFEEFPEDDALWMVKCIDRFRLPHAATESASVEVRLQRVEGLSFQGAARATRSQICDLFGGNERGQEAFRNARVHPGSLPALRVGQIYRRGAYRAELPAEIITVELPQAERSGRSGNAGDERPRPSGMDGARPCPNLSTREFDLFSSDWRNQRVLVLSQDGRDVILPRTVIFQCFYGPHSEMADAFTSGPWDNIRPRLVSDSDFESGLRTRAAPELNEWHLVLATLIPNDFRWHVALFVFDSYAQKQARAIYSDRLAQRKRPDRDEPWFCSATLPFNPDYPLTLKLKGYTLRPAPGRPQGAFLATSIVSATPGQPLPGLAFSRSNDGSDAPNVVHVDAPRPYRSRDEKGHHPPDRPSVGSTYAPPTGGAVAELLTSSFEWGGHLQERVLEKQSSKRYTGGQEPAVDPAKGPDSTAKPVAGGQAGRHLQMAHQVRPRVVHFDNLINCLSALDAASRIDRFCVIQPEETIQKAERDGRIGWDLAEESTKRFWTRPLHWWRMITPRGTWGSALLGRTVLVVEVEWLGATALLFEIECRPSELGGYTMAAMVFRNGRPHGVNDLCRAMLREIAYAEGRNLRSVSHEIAVAEGGCGASYRHRYVIEAGQKRLDADSLMAFLEKHRAISTSGVINADA